MKEKLIIHCDKCEGNYVLRKGKYGFFAGCSKFPLCKSTLNIPELVQKFILIYGINIFKWNRICFRCKQETPIYSYFPYYDLGFLDGSLGDLFRNFSGVGIGDIKFIDKFLECNIESIKMRYSKTVNDLYIANTCIYCGVIQGHYFVVEDPHEILYELIHTYEMDKYFYKKILSKDLDICIEDLKIFSV